jgi:sulfite reductase alpha subunit-like flavoprotein
MGDTTGRTALVLYGSETGNAQDVAGELGRVTERLHFLTRVVDMDSVDPVSGSLDHRFAAQSIVCSRHFVEDRFANLLCYPLRIVHNRSRRSAHQYPSFLEAPAQETATSRLSAEGKVHHVWAW